MLLRTPRLSAARANRLRRALAALPPALVEAWARSIAIWVRGGNVGSRWLHRRRPPPLPALPAAGAPSPHRLTQPHVSEPPLQRPARRSHHGTAVLGRPRVPVCAARLDRAQGDGCAARWMAADQLQPLLQQTVIITNPCARSLPALFRRPARVQDRRSARQSPGVCGAVPHSGAGPGSQRQGELGCGCLLFA